jgi:PAS domain S-box-containing protein
MNLFGNKSKDVPIKGISNGKNRFEIILNTIEDGVVLFDADGNTQLFNPGASNITGWKPEDAVGIHYGQVLQLVNDKGEILTAEGNPFEQVFKTGLIVHDNKAILMNRSKSQIPISLSVNPLLDETNKVTAAIAVFRDVSSQRAEEKQRADFISTASHEMRTPVAAIEGYISLAMNDKVSTIDNRARDFLEKAHSSTQHLGQLFQDLLTSAKAEDGRLTSHPKVVEMGSVLEQLTNDLRFTAEKKGLFVEFKVGTSNTINARAEGAGKIIKPLYYIYADDDRLREVVSNLFENAVKYTDEGKVTLGITGDNQVVQCSIKDTGSGIPSEDLPHLFQKFYRVDSSATRTIGGTGLGLFIARKIVELYNGRIWAESELGKGSSFYINLPRLSTEQANSLLEKDPLVK